MNYMKNDLYLFTDLVPNESISSLVEDFHFNCFDRDMSGGEKRIKGGKKRIRFHEHVLLFDRKRMI